MPDIDVDFAKEIRSDTIRYVQKLYGEESVACIRTVMTQQAKDCIHNMARVYGYKMYPQEKEDDPGRSRIRGLGNQLCGLLPDDLSTLKEQLPLLKANGGNCGKYDKILFFPRSGGYYRRRQTIIIVYPCFL